MRFVAAVVVSLGAPALVTLIAPLARDILPRNPIELGVLLYILAVAAAAVVGGLWGGVTAAVASFVGQYYAFVEPMPALRLFHQGELIVLGVFLVVAIGLTRLISRLRTARAFEQVARERTAFLADASSLLSESLDFHECVSHLASFAVPRLADLCLVDIVDHDGLIRTIVAAHSDRIDAALAENLLHQRSLAPDDPSATATAIRRRQPAVYSRVDDSVLDEAARDERHRDLLRGLRLRSLMIVPLETPRSPIGAITYAFAGERRRYTDEDLALTRDLARRAGTVLDNVLLYEERSRTARLLQQSLLPPHLPSIDGLEMAVRFHPVSDADLIGGDFYDVFDMGAGAWALVVGDVCGKGVEAATLTGLARHTIRAAALRRTPPSQVLRTLNDAILRHGSERFCTAVFAMVEPGPSGTRVTVAAGGHPLPLVQRGANGSVESVGKPGTLLGVFADPDLEDVEVSLRDGDTMLLFTDGALDERLVHPEDALLEALRQTAGRPAEATAAEIERTRPQQGSMDDAAVVVVRVACPAVPTGVGGKVAWRST